MHMGIKPTLNIMKRSKNILCMILDFNLLPIAWFLLPLLSTMDLRQTAIVTKMRGILPMAGAQILHLVISTLTQEVTLFYGIWTMLFDFPLVPLSFSLLHLSHIQTYQSNLWKPAIPSSNIHLVVSFTGAITAGALTRLLWPMQPRSRRCRGKKIENANGEWTCKSSCIGVICLREIGKGSNELQWG